MSGIIENLAISCYFRDNVPSASSAVTIVRTKIRVDPSKIPRYQNLVCSSIVRKESELQTP